MSAYEHVKANRRVVWLPGLPTKKSARKASTINSTTLGGGDGGDGGGRVCGPVSEPVPVSVSVPVPVPVPVPEPAPVSVPMGKTLPVPALVLALVWTSIACECSTKADKERIAASCAGLYRPSSRLHSKKAPKNKADVTTNTVRVVVVAVAETVGACPAMRLRSVLVPIIRQ